ncbi:MAG: GntR family transcriptional regulator [Desertimonas sp.]
MPDERNAYDLIRAAIVEQRYLPGQRLVEQRIAEEFGLSRTPVREALRSLEAEGLVIAERNRGASVRPMSPTEVVDLYGLRIRLESYAAELAAQRATADEIAALATAVERFSAVRATLGDADDLDDVRALNAANRTVHDLILDAARHHRLSAMLGRTVDIPLVFRAFRVFGRDEIERSDLFHHLILDAIGRRDHARAGQLMAEHIHQGMQAVLDGMAAEDRAEDYLSESRS